MQFRIWFRVFGSSWEMWKMGCIVCMCLGSQISVDQAGL
jgi:hypothetical protein